MLTSTAPRRTPWRYLNVLLVLLSGLICTYFISQNPTRIASDDAVFYAQIGYRGFASPFPSFNGIDLTNGFHPLNQILVAAIADLVRCFGFFPSKEHFISVVVFVDGLLILGAILLLGAYLRRKNTEPLVACVSLGLVGAYLFGGMYLSEAHLNALCISLFLYRWSLCWERHRPADILILGFCAAVMTLARLDNVFVVFFSGLWVLRYHWRSLPFYLVGPALLLGGYAALNYYVFGSIAPVSAAMKGIFPDHRPLTVALGELTPLGMMIGTLLPLCAALLIMRRIRTPELWFLTLSALALFFYYLLFQYASYHSWYYIQAVIALSLASASLCVNWPQGRGSRTILRALFGILLLFPPIYGYLKGHGQRNFNLNEAVGGYNWTGPSYAELGRRLGEALPSDARVFAFDMPGYLAYFSGVSVTAHDCLTLNVTACHQMQTDLPAFFAERKISYLLWPFATGCAEEVPLVEYFRHMPMGTLKLDCQHARQISADPGVQVVPIVGVQSR